ncbi:MAG TPA: helix-turn-helix transcriptional regulator [Chloroflexota bacterium]
MKLPRLRHHREWALLTQQQLAARAAVARSTIVEIEHGGEARFETIRKLATALDVQPAELMREAPQAHDS